MESSSSTRTTTSSMSSKKSATSRGDQGYQPELKRKKTNEYSNITEVQADMNIMLENAKAHNLPDSHLYKTAVKLQNLMQQNVLQLLTAENDSDVADSPMISEKILLETSGIQTGAPLEFDSDTSPATGFIKSSLTEKSSGLRISPVASKFDSPVNNNKVSIKAKKDMETLKTPEPFKNSKVKSKDSKFLYETEPLDEEAIIIEDDRDDEVEIPSLVVEVLLEGTKDVDLLKTCRLVNKYWNGLACSSLQKNSVVELKETFENDNEFYSKFNAILLSLAPRSSSMPCPFKNFHISTYGFVKDRFYNLILGEQFHTTKLTIKMGGPANVQRLNKFLKAKQGELTSIKLEMNGLHHVNTLQAFSDIKLPCLKSLIIDGSDNNPRCNCTSIEVLINAIADSSFQYLTLKCISCCWMPILKMNLSRIVKLKLDRSFSLPEEFWDVIANLQIPSLQSLEIFHYDENTQWHKKFEALLRNVSSTLLKLNNNNLVNHTNLHFPKLKDVNMSCPSDMSDCFTDERFPSLQSITLMNAEHMKIVTDVFHPLKSVRSLYIRVMADQATDIPFVMLNLARIFPNVEKFGISLYEETPSAYLVCINRTFTNLKALNINDIKERIDFTTLWGTSVEEVKKHLRLGMGIQDIPRRPSIFDFTELESLVLNDVCDEDILCYCLFFLTKLKYLEFSWRYDSDEDEEVDEEELLLYVPIQEIGDSLKHFNRIGIDYGVSQDLLERFQKALPGCEVTRSIENRSPYYIHFICTR